ncbi:unnamed protein product [Prorocentrum cordatum]|uniref:Uncharacterized protein n=2 Tax=Prorocentrum cordatum TaxID=2364126 RepID=A0ABN9TWQ6_9DINO|nr:unnamed protein product [Polarella glacialis]
MVFFAIGLTTAVCIIGVRSKKPDTKPDVRFVAQFMCECKAREVWDYSRANLAQFSKDGLVLDSLSVGSDVVARWVPPGYTALLEGGADLWSKTRKDDKLAFIGKLKSRPDGVLNSLHQTPFWKGRVHEEGNVWNIQNLGRFVSEYPMQLILHKNQMCCPSDNVLETFRLAQLLPNKACVISAAVHPLDADGWGGIVHFFGNMSEAEAVVSGLRKDVRACQRRSYALYKARFDSSKILAESGFLDMWNGGAH